MESQSLQQQHLQVADEITKANNEALELITAERKGLKTTLSDKEHAETIEKIRNPISKFTAVQSGVASASAKSVKRRKRSQASKLNQTLL